MQRFVAVVYRDYLQCYILFSIPSRAEMLWAGKIFLAGSQRKTNYRPQTFEQYVYATKKYIYFAQKGCIKLFKGHSKDMYNVTENLF